MKTSVESIVAQRVSIRPFVNFRVAPSQPAQLTP
jgi:hypothetical protein